MTKITPTVSPDWQSEFNATAFKYHLLIARVGLLLNLFFGIGDYFNCPAHFTTCIIFRIVVSFLTLLVVLFKNKFVNRPEIIVLVPVIGIALENAYIYSILDGAEFQKHTLAFIALFIAAGMFILWKLIYSLIVVVVTFTASVILFWMNSHMLLNEILINGGLLTFSVALLSILLIHSRTNLTKKEIISRLALAESNNQLAITNEIIEEKNKDILDSIRYASTIQQAVITSEEYIRTALLSAGDVQGDDNFFVLYLPKDIVAGDFYWAYNRDDEFFIATGDCTGHGVPGAFMSLMGINFLNEIVVEEEISSPGETLNRLRQHIISAFATGKTERKDGMDISFYKLNKKERTITFAAANNPLWLCRNNQITEYKPDKMPVGTHYGTTTPFHEQTFELQKGDIVYTFTDGYADQFGGPKGKKFKYKQFEELLLSNHHLPMKEQQNILEKSMNSWKGNLEQVDDILVIGVKV